MLVIWKERANPRRARAGAESAVMSSPAKRTRPRSGSRLPASWLIRVVLPAPFGPMIAWVSPSRISRATSSLARGDDVDLEILEGETHAIIGPNGAGDLEGTRLNS